MNTHVLSIATTSPTSTQSVDNGCPPTLPASYADVARVAVGKNEGKGIDEALPKRVSVPKASSSFEHYPLLASSQESLDHVPTPIVSYASVLRLDTPTSGGGPLPKGSPHSSEDNIMNMERFLNRLEFPGIGAVGDGRKSQIPRDVHVGKSSVKPIAGSLTGGQTPNTRKGLLDRIGAENVIDPGMKGEKACPSNPIVDSFSTSSTSKLCEDQGVNDAETPARQHVEMPKKPGGLNEKMIDTGKDVDPGMKHDQAGTITNKFESFAMPFMSEASVNQDINDAEAQARRVMDMRAEWSKLTSGTGPPVPPLSPEFQNGWRSYIDRHLAELPDPYQTFLTRDIHEVLEEQARNRSDGDGVGQAEPEVASGGYINYNCGFINPAATEEAYVSPFDSFLRNLPINKSN